MKIVELTGKDFTKGQSQSAYLPMGGLFRSMSNFDPFELTGTMYPSLTPDTFALSTTPKFLTSFNSSGTDYIYAFTDTKLYQLLKDSPYTLTDVTSSINNGGAGALARICGRAKWKGGLVYAFIDSLNNSAIKYNSLPVAGGSDVLMKSSWVLDATQDFLPMVQGADGNLYIGNANRILVMTSATGTAGNTTFYYIDDGFTIRDMVNDGRYLVVFADNNTVANGSRRVGSYRTRVYFWDLVQTDATPRIVPTVMYDLDDAYVIAAAQLDSQIFFFGYSGLYVCNSASSPQMVRPYVFSSTDDRFTRPLNPSQVAVRNGSIYWVDGINSLNTDVYAFGNPTSGQQKIFYRPYTTGVTALSTCLLWSGNNLIRGTSTPSLNFFNVGSTRGTATVSTVITNVDRPMTYDYTKVDLALKLATGQSVTVTAYSQATNEILSTETKSYSASNPKQTLTFRRTPQASSPSKFADISITVSSVGALLSRVSVYATPLPDANEEL